MAHHRALTCFKNLLTLKKLIKMFNKIIHNQYFQIIIKYQIFKEKAFRLIN